MKLRRRIGSAFLALVMVLSLIPTVAVSALAATGNDSKVGDYVTLDYSTGNANIKITVNVFCDGTQLESFTVNDGARTDNNMSIHLNDGVQNTYDIENATIDPNPGVVSTGSSDHWNFSSWSVGIDDPDTTINVYLCPQYVEPEIVDPIDTWATLHYQVTQPALLKLLHDNGVDVTADTKIINQQAVKLHFVEKYGNNMDWSLNEVPSAADNLQYYQGTLSDVSDKGNPENIRYIEITYTQSDGNEYTKKIYSGNLRYVNVGNNTYEIESRNQDEHIVVFYHEDRITSAVWSPYDVRFISHGASVGDLPTAPEYDYTNYEFVAWTQKHDGGLPVISNTLVNDDMNVFPQYKDKNSNPTRIHVMNNDDLLKTRVAELFSVSTNDINWETVKITVHGANGDATNPDYGIESGIHNGWDDEYSYYLVYNYLEGIGDYENDSIYINDISSISISADKVDGSHFENDVVIEKGPYAGDFSISTGSYDASWLVELYINPEDSYPVNPNPDPGTPDLSVTKAVEIPGDKVTASVGDTLEYTITVTNSGDGNANDVTVWDSLWTDPSGSVQINGEGSYTSVADGYCTVNVPANGTTTITYTYTVPGEKAGTTLTNNVWIGNDNEPASDDPQDSVTVDVDALTPDQVTITYHGNGGIYTNQDGQTFDTLTETDTYGSQLTLYNTTYYFQREGYTNLGWSITENGSVNFQGAAEVTLNNETFAGLSETKHIDLYAVWAKDAPTFDELNNLGLKVTIDCVNNVGHDDGQVSLIESTPQNPTCVIKDEGNKTYTISIDDPDDYIAQYNKMDQAEGYTHTYFGFQDNVKAFKVHWDGTQWVVDQDKVTILAKCMPEAPTDDQLKTLLDDAVKVQCVEESTHNCTFDVKDGYTVSGPTADGNGSWTYTVTVTADPYVADFNGKGKGEHWLVDSTAKTKDIVLTWNAADQTWAKPDQVVFNVTCKPTVPTTEELNILFPNGVQVDCLSQNGHSNQDYDLADKTYTTNVEWKDGQWTCTVTVAGESYVTQYVESIGWPHTANDDTRSVTLVWENGAWTKTKDNNVMVVFDVTCQAPKAPIYDQMKDLFKVQIDCITSDQWGDEYEHENQDYSLIEDSYTLGDITANADGTWNLKVTVQADKYVDKYNQTTNVNHTLSKEKNKTVTLVYKDNQWTTEKDIVVFDVKCSTPNAPGGEEITDILDSKNAVKVICQSDEKHQTKDKIYAKLLPNEEGNVRYEIGEVTPAADGTFTCNITILPTVYVAQYNADTNLTHWLVDESDNAVIPLTWKDGKWTAPEQEGDTWATFEVTCLPEAPTDDNLPDLLDGNDAVKVICVDSQHTDKVYQELLANEDGKTRYVIGDVVRNEDGTITCDITILPEVYVNQYNTDTKTDHWLTNDAPQTIPLTWNMEQKGWTAPTDTEWEKDAWAIFEVSCAAITIIPADIEIYTGGNGYNGVTVDENGTPLENPTESGLPEPGYHIELPDAVNAWLEDNGINTDDEATNLAEILDFAYNYDGETRNWNMTQAGIYDANAETGAPTRYVYTLDAAQVDDQKIPVRILYFEDLNGNEACEDNEVRENDQITMSAEAAHANYLMTINPGELDQSQIKAVFTVGDKTITCNVNIGTGNLTVKSVADKEPDTNLIADSGAEVTANTPTAVAGNDVQFYVNDSQVTVDPGRVGLLVDSVSNNPTFNNQMEQDAISEVREENSSLPSDAQAQSFYLDLVDTDNGNAVVTMGDDDNLTIYWPMPEDADPNGQFHVVHYTGMDRTTTTDAGNLGDTEILQVGKDGDHLTFTTDSFSPFVLVYEKDNGSNPPVVDPDPDPDDPTPPPVDPGDKPELNTEDHYAYIVGYPDGTVRPEGDITRAEVATIFFRLLTDESRDEFWSQTNDYTDVDADAWYNNAVSTLSNAGILNGYEDGTFQPDGNITRAEFATITARFFEATYDGEDLFSDIAGHWAADYINQAANAGIVDGYPDGTFRPQQNITRAEAMTMVNRTIDRHPDAEHFLDGMITWSDNHEDAWYYEQVQEATNSHEYTMNTDDEQNPYEIWTELLPVRDWAQLEKEWSDAHSGQSGGDVV